MYHLFNISVRFNAKLLCLLSSITLQILQFFLFLFENKSFMAFFFLSLLNDLINPMCLITELSLPCRQGSRASVPG